LAYSLPVISGDIANDKNQQQMKRIIVFLALFFTIGTASFAQAQQPPQKLEHIRNPKKNHGDKASKAKGEKHKYDKHKHKHKHRHMHHKKK